MTPDHPLLLREILVITLEAIMENGKAFLLAGVIEILILNKTGIQILDGTIDHQSRQPRQITEQDGLLGNGSFPRRYNMDTQLGPLVQRWEQTSTINLHDLTRQYLIQEETQTHSTRPLVQWSGTMKIKQRRRRVSFELMRKRKEQQKALQGNLEIQKPSTGLPSPTLGRRDFC